MIPHQQSSSEALLLQLHFPGGAVLQHNVDGKNVHRLQKHRERPKKKFRGTKFEHFRCRYKSYNHCTQSEENQTTEHPLENFKLPC